MGDKADEVIRAIQQQMAPDAASCTVKLTAPIEDAPVVDITNIRLSSPPAYKMGDLIATRKFFLSFFFHFPKEIKILFLIF